MTTHAKMFLGAAGITAVMAAAWAADPPETQAPPEAPLLSEQEASCLLKISSDPAVFPMEPTILQYLLATSGVQRDAITEVLGKEAYADVKLELVGGGGVTVPSLPGTPRAAPGGGYGPMGTRGSDPRGAMGGPSMGRMDPRSGVMAGMGGAAAAGNNPFAGGGGLPPAVAVDLPASSEQMLMGRLVVTTPGAGHAREVMVAVTKRFQAALEKVGVEETARLNRELVDATKETAAAKQQLERLQKERQEMLNGTPFNDLSRESVLEMSRKFETERQDTAVKIESLRARNQAYQKRISEVGSKAKEAADQQQAHEAKVRDLQRRMDELKANEEELKAKAKSVKDAEEQLKMRMDQQRATEDALAQLNAAMQNLQPGARMGDLNDQMSALSIDLAETEARLKVLDTKCTEMRELLAKADEYEMRVGLELPLAQAAYESARLRQRSLEYRLSALHPPTVTIIGG